MKKIFILTITFFACINLIAQELQTIVPPGPNAASLGQYADIPVSNYTGVPNISILIYLVKSGDIEVPITLSYHASGIKVAQEASWVGLGWALNAGGLITKQIRGKDDFSVNGGYTSSLSFPYADANNFPDPSSDSSHPIDYYKTIYNGSTDAEPDIYNYNFLGYSGKLFFEKQLGDVITATCVHQNNMIFKYNKTTKEWIVTDGNGWQYFFGTTAKSAVERTTNHSMSSVIQSLDHPYFPNTIVGADIDPVTFDSSWYLTKILSNTGESVDFYYKTNGYKSLSQISYSENKYDLLGFSTLYDSDLATTGPLVNISTLHSASQQEIEDVYLEHIEYNNGTVFFQTNDRDDIEKAVESNQTYYYPQMLSNIEVKNAHNDPIQKTEFNYSYFNNSPSLRLKLDSVQEFNALLESKPAHKFNYSSIPLPPKNSYKIDYWGYYNNKRNEYITRYTYYDIQQYLTSSNSYPVQNEPFTKISKMLSPYYDDIEEPNMISIYGANREPSPNYMQAAMLESIEYPLGYTQVFTFEPNDYNAENIIIYNDNDVLYSADSYGDSVTSFTLSHTAAVSLSTLLYYASPNYNPNSLVPIQNINIRLEKSDGNPIISFDQPQSPFTDDYSEFNYVPECKVVLPSGDYKLIADSGGDDDFIIELTASFIEKIATNKKIGSGVRIKSIETFEDNSLQVLQKKNEYNYEIAGMSTGRLLSPKKHAYSQSFIETLTGQIVPGYVPVTQLLTNYIVRSSNSFIPFGYSGNGRVIGYDQVSVSRKNKGEEILGTSIYEYRNDEEIPIEGFLPGVPNYIHLNNGQLLNEKHLNSNNNTVRETTINYKQSPNIINVKGIKTFGAYWEPNNALIGARFYDVYSEWWYPEQETTIVYDIDGNNPITTTIEYEYENLEHKNLTKTSTINSKEETFVTTNEYPHDYPIGTNMAVSDFDAMIADNIVNPVIKQTSSLNDKILSTQIKTYKKWDISNTQYDSSDDVYLPELIKTAKGGNVLEDRITYHNYDTNGNPLEVSKKDGTHIVYIWGYNQQYPIAKIENATYSQVNGFVSNLQTLSNADDSKTDENALRTALDAMRNDASLSKAMVTTYTYDPLIGVTSITDPRGETIYYHYDDFNRLEYVKDAEGNILSKNEYHYKNQQ